jgi:hypothetical protein
MYEPGLFLMPGAVGLDRAELLDTLEAGLTKLVGPWIVGINRYRNHLQIDFEDEDPHRAYTTINEFIGISPVLLKGLASRYKRQIVPLRTGYQCVMVEFRVRHIDNRTRIVYYLPAELELVTGEIKELRDHLARSLLGISLPGISNITGLSVYPPEDSHGWMIVAEHRGKSIYLDPYDPWIRSLTKILVEGFLARVNLPHFAGRLTFEINRQPLQTASYTELTG